VIILLITLITQLIDCSFNAYLVHVGGRCSHMTEGHFAADCNCINLWAVLC